MKALHTPDEHFIQEEVPEAFVATIVDAARRGA
jgi:hypothetical protein